MQGLAKTADHWGYVCSDADADNCYLPRLWLDMHESSPVVCAAVRSLANIQLHRNRMLGWVDLGDGLGRMLTA